MSGRLSLLIGVLLAVYLPFASLNWAPVSPLPTQARLTLVQGGFTAITDIANAGDNRLFVVEQAGTIRIVQGGSTLPAPFLDIHTRVACCGERGLLGLAFHPQFAANHTFYVNYTYLAGGTALRTRVSRFTVSASNPNAADPNSEVVVLEFAQPYVNHNGGSLHFGPDGYLYIGAGDGGSGYDPQNNAQDRGKLLGKILRIDVNKTSGADCGLAPGRNYGIPAGNPFADGAGRNCDEVWAYGLRNPWRISFDRQTGDLWIADVGQDTREEVDFQPAASAGGQNYGWDCWEGTLRNGTDPSPACAANPPVVAPVHDYDHAGGRCSITGGYVYRGKSYPALQGVYFFADYCSSQVWALRREASGSTSVAALALSGAALANPTTFGEDASGELYVASPSAVFRVSDPAAP